MRTLPVALKEELRKTEAKFEKRSTIAQRPFERLPKSYVFVRERDNPYPHDAFADGLPISKVQRQTEIEDQYYQLQHMRQIDQCVLFPLVRNIALPQELDRLPK